MTAADDDRRVLAARGGKQRNAGKRQHIQHRGIAHLVLQGERDNVKVADRVAAFERAERKSILLHLLLHIQPGGKHALTPDVRLTVQHTVQNAQPEVGHADLVGVRKAERHAAVDPRLVLDDLPVFPAAVASGLGHAFQNG